MLREAHAAREPIHSTDRRHGRRVLAVRAMAGETAWLDGSIVWHEDRVAWRTEQDTVSPSPADLALVQRRLYQIRRYPVAARIALGDVSAWLERRQARLEAAKRLLRLSAPDLPALARRAAERDSKAMERLAALLTAEALCANEMNTPVSATLVACGPPAEPAVRRLVADEHKLPAARALAALVLGAIRRKARGPYDGPGLPDAALGPRWLRRTYEWGVKRGLPPHPALIVALLDDDRGPALVARYLATLASPGPFTVPGEVLRDLLGRDVPADQVVAIAESTRDAEDLASRILRYRGELPDRPADDRFAAAERLLEERRQAISTLAAVCQDYVCCTADLAVVPLIVRFAHALLDLGVSIPESLEAVTHVLRSGLSLPPVLQKAYLEILVDRFNALWNTRGVQLDKGGRIPPVWLRQRQNRQVKPLVNLLSRCKNTSIASEAAQLGIQDLLAGYRWHDKDLYRLAIELAQYLDATGKEHHAWSLCDLLDAFPDARTARTALQPLLKTSAPALGNVRRHLFDTVHSALPEGRRDRLDALSRLAPYLSQLSLHARTHADDACMCQPLASAALALDRSAPQHAASWLEWLLSDVVQQARKVKDIYEYQRSMQLGVLLGTALSDGDFGRFRSIVRAATQHELDYRWDLLEDGTAVLGGFPALHEPLALLFEQQPRRCVDLIVRLGLTRRLGAQALAPLAALQETGTEILPNDASRSGWHGLLQQAPELAPVAQAYARARTLIGGRSDLPGGVRRALEQPLRLARELEHLEGMLGEHPNRSDLEARAAALRTRLAAPHKLRDEAVSEAGERLRQITAEVQLAAAERQVLACYQDRLATVTGQRPPALEMDDDLLNAVLLTADIDANRRLLRKLLQATLSGDRLWPRRHPGNAAFLEELVARGIDVRSWLGAHPRVYSCGGVSGERVHLRLERDPLRILQMGNDFDTCLSLGAFNAFSTVANACELNKRVIYAVDNRGRVVGRKLIGIDAEGGLVGFRTYTSLSHEAGNRELHAIFRRYVGAFAACCRLELHDEGNVPILFAQRWYDDGVVAWDDGVPTGGQVRTAVGSLSA